jgi:RNA polymerase sigma factor (sigma-70 family)
VTVATGRVEGLLRELAPQVLGALVRRYHRFDACEDALQEALLAATQQWPEQGVPANPRAWLVTVGSRRMVDEIRSNEARRRREDSTAALAGLDAALAPAADADDLTVDEDALRLLFLCCHPAISPPSQLALTLRAVGGLTTDEIAGALLVPSSTVGQRISRAKKAIADAGATFDLPPEDERGKRLDVVLQVLYLVFNEGYTSTSGEDLHRVELSDEAIRLTRLLHRQLADDPEVTGLLALMLLTDARRAARTDADGHLVPLAEQDRARWDADAIAEGVALVEAALPVGELGPYQLQAAIAALHDEATTAEATDWAQIVALYGVLEEVAPNPMATLNRAVAVGMAEGPEAGLAALDAVADDERLAEHHRVPAVRAHLLDRAGRVAEAHEAYLDAARRTTSLPERHYLEAKAAALPPNPTRSVGGPAR